MQPLFRLYSSAQIHTHIQNKRMPRWRPSQWHTRRECSSGSSHCLPGKWRRVSACWPWWSLYWRRWAVPQTLWRNSVLLAQRSRSWQCCRPQTFRLLGKPEMIAILPRLHLETQHTSRRRAQTSIRISTGIMVDDPNTRSADTHQSGSDFHSMDLRGSWIDTWAGLNGKHSPVPKGMRSSKSGQILVDHVSQSTLPKTFSKTRLFIRGQCIPKRSIENQLLLVQLHVAGGTSPEEWHR